MKEVLIISGKGGTGKTSITACFAKILGKKAIVADCDVDAADMHLLMNPQNSQTKDFYSGFVAKISPRECTNCSKCKAVCHFNAIDIKNKKHFVDELYCEGCGYCALICPSKAIEMKSLKVGKVYISSIKTNTVMVHAQLEVGGENSGKLVAEVKNLAKKIALESKSEFVLIDGSPGIGCPVVASISGADLVVFVTESTVSGLHDLKRVNELVKKFGIRSSCIINKSDINIQKTQEIKQFLKNEKITLLDCLSYDESFTKAMIQKKTVVEYDQKFYQKFSNIWQKIVCHL